MRLRSWLLLIAGLVLLPSSARAQALLMTPVPCAQDCAPPIFPLPSLMRGRAPDVPVLFAGSLGSLRFNQAGLAVGLQGQTWSADPFLLPQVQMPSNEMPLPPPPALVRAQAPEVPPVIFTGFLSHPRYDDGGLYFGVEGVLWTTNHPLGSQTVGSRGFLDLDGSVTGTPHTFVGSGAEALNTSQLLGPTSQQAGWNLFAGYRFQGGVVVELGWLHLIQAPLHATASLLPPNLQPGAQFENTFLFSPVTNFTTLWAGPAQKFPQGDPGATFGIWNGASFMQIELVQRFDIYQINARLPIFETADYRTYGIFGPRIAWVWDQFRWTTVATDQFGNSGPEFTALYTNTVSNRMYGIHAGWGGDWWLGSTPIGGFAFTFEAEAALYADMVRTSASYALGDGTAESGRSLRKTLLAPGLEARLGLWYYPWEAISINIGYDVITFFNTMSSQKPIDFNLGQVDAAYNYQFFRYFQGLRFGITFVF
jgi:hypothetical protein